MAIAAARIRFPGNPWPKGHGIKKVKWSAVLEPEGLRFHLHLESEDYYEDDDRDDEDEPDDNWKSRGVWGNFHSCTLSSTMWGAERAATGESAGGFLVAKPGEPIDLEKLEGKTFAVDPVEGNTLGSDVDVNALKFGIYLLGHDSVCDHKITFVKHHGPRTYDVHWRARIALTYTGNNNLDHSLEATLPRLRLDASSCRTWMARRQSRSCRLL